MPYARMVFYVEKQDTNWLLVHFGREATFPIYLEFNDQIFILVKAYPDQYHRSFKHFRDHELEHKYNSYGEYELFDMRGVTAKPVGEL